MVRIMVPAESGGVGCRGLMFFLEGEGIAYLTARVGVAHITRISHGDKNRTMNHRENGKWCVNWGWKEGKIRETEELFWCDATTVMCAAKVSLPKS